MAIGNTTKWKTELLECGSGIDERNEKMINRYIELLDMVTGNESEEVFSAIIESMLFAESFGANECALSKLGLFDSGKYCIWITSHVLRNIDSNRDKAIDLLILTRNSIEIVDGKKQRKYYFDFLKIINQLEINERKKIILFMLDVESNELDDKGFFGLVIK